MEANEGEKKDLPPPPSKTSRFRNAVRGAALVGVAALTTALGAKGNTTDSYSSETGTPPAATEKMDQKVVIPEVARDAEEEKIPIPFVNVMQGTNSKFVEGADIVISDPASWAEYWKMINEDPNRSAPEIDFSKNRMLLAAQGPSAGGRSMIEIKNVNEGKDTIEVKIESTIPNGSCPLLPVESSPFQVVSVPRTEKPINFTPTQDVGCYDIGEATSSRYNPEEGKATYNASTVTKTPYEPSQ